MWMWIPLKAYTAHAVLIDIHEDYKQNKNFFFLAFMPCLAGMVKEFMRKGIRQISLVGMICTYISISLPFPASLWDV